MVMPIKPGAALPLAELGTTRGASPIGKTGSTPGIGGVAPVGGESTTDFTSTLKKVLSEANESQVKAEQASADYASGKQNDLHGTMITMTEADINLRLVAQVRNKVIDAYREVMRMGS